MHQRGDVECADVRMQSPVRSEVDALDRLARAREERMTQRARLAAQRDDAAVVIGVGVDVEQPRAAGGEGVRDLRDGYGVPPLRHVGDGKEHLRQSTYVPASRTCVAPIVSEASVTTTSRCTGTLTFPPKPALAPNATCAVPRIFSSSSTLPVSVAFSFVPTPSSARLRPFGAWASSIARNDASEASASAPSRTSIRSGSSYSPVIAAERAKIVPSPPAGATNPSPHGRFPNAPGAVMSPS